MGGGVVIAAIMGAVTGSFANNVISHYVNKKQFDWFRSRCLCGKYMLKLLEIIPIFSYLMLKGKCRRCDEGIPSRYILIELIFPILAVLTYYNSQDLVLFSYNYFFYFSLFTIAVIDYYEFIIPDMILMLFVPMIIIKYALFSDIIILNFISSLSLALIVFILGLIITRIKDKKALGFGDIKLIFAASLIMDFPNSIIALWLASLLGLSYVTLLYLFNKVEKLDFKVPFGSFIGLAFSIVHYYSKEINNFSINLFHHI